MYENLDLLTDLETRGLEMAKGEHLVHCDLYPHNILLTEESVYFVDWPHARQGAPYLDVLTVLATAASQGIDGTVRSNASAHGRSRRTGY